MVFSKSLPHHNNLRSCWKYHLLTETETCPEMNELNEGAIYYVYINAAQQERANDEEIWAPAISAAYDLCFPKKVQSERNEENEEGEDDEEMNEEEGGDDEEMNEDEDEETRRPNLEKYDQKVFEEACETLADRILWDRDFEMFDEFEEHTVENAIGLRDQTINVQPGFYHQMGIDSQYFNARVIPQPGMFRPKFV